MRSIAERRVLRMLAAAPGDGFRFGDIDLLRREAGAFVRAVAERLALGTSAGAPPRRAGPRFLYEGRFLGNDRFAHNVNGLLDCWIDGVME